MNGWDIVGTKVHRFKNEDVSLLVEQQKGGKWRYSVTVPGPGVIIGEGRNLDTIELAQQVAENVFEKYKREHR